MIGDYFGYGISALTAFGAIVFGIRQAGSADRSEMGKRLAKVERRVQMLERREVWHERKEGILIDALNDARIAIPDMPPPPEAWTSGSEDA